MRILVVEDDAELSRRLGARLREEGYGVDVATDGEDGLHAGLHYPIDAAIVDVGISKLSGFDVIRRWRREGRVFPIVILTARDEWRDKVTGLDAGADDYVIKPVTYGEILARLRALTRRAHGWAAAEIVCGPYVLNTAAHTLRCGGAYIDLTSFEYRVLEYMMHRTGQTLSSAELEAHLYSEGQERASNLVAQFIFRLRRKLSRPGLSNPIETVMRDGYRFTIGAGRDGLLSLRRPKSRS